MSDFADAVLIRPTALFDRNCKDIADAAFGLDDTRHLRVCLQFAPQPQHLNIDAAIEDVFVEPGCLQQILARKRPLRRIEEGKQQGVLAFAQGNRPFLRIDEAPATTIKPPSAEIVSPRSTSRVRKDDPLTRRPTTGGNRATNR